MSNAIYTKPYIGTKVIEATEMNLGDYNTYRGWTIPENEDPETPGYIVVYPDGHISWSPAETFELAYNPLTNITFGQAVELMKVGKKVSREGWNGKGMFLYYVAEGRYPAKMEAIQGVFEDDLVPYRPYIALKTAQGDVVPWCATQSDILAEDFFVV